MIGLILCVSNKYVHFPSDKCRKGHTSTATGHAPNFHKVYQLEKEIRPNCSSPLLSRKKNVLRLIALRELHSYTYKELSSSIIQNL